MYEGHTEITESLLHLHIPPPPPPPPPPPQQTHYVNTSVSCRITLQPVSLDVRLEPKGADEVCVVCMYVRARACVCASTMHLHPVVGCFEPAFINSCR